MGCMTVGAADIVSPVLTAPKIVVSLFARVAGKTSFGNCLGVLALKGNDASFYGRVLDVFFAGAMTLLATLNLVLPAVELTQFRMFCFRKRVELIFVTGFAGLGTDIVIAVGIRHSRNIYAVALGSQSFGSGKRS
jgi:hypothetical protein